MNRVLPGVKSVFRAHKRYFKQQAFKLSAAQNIIDLKQDSEESECLQDELKKKRDVCRLPDRVRRSHLKMEMFPLDRSEHYIMKNLRKYYAVYGRKSGINPGLMWPSKEYLEVLKKFENEFSPLREMTARIQARREKELAERKEREEFIENNMKKLEGYMKEFEVKKAKKEAEAAMQRKRKEKLIEEVHEYLGYQLDPDDERFKKALELKEEEERKAMRKAKKQAKEQKMLSMLLEAASTKSDTK